MVDLVLPSRRYGVEIVTLTSGCFVEFEWVFLDVVGVFADGGVGISFSGIGAGGLVIMQRVRYRFTYVL